MNKFERWLAAQQNEPTPEPSLAEQLLTVQDNADQIRELVEAQRRKLVADGYPEAVTWRMASDMWAGIWRGGQG